LLKYFLKKMEDVEMMDAQPASFPSFSIPFHITSPTSKDSKFIKPLYPASKSKVAKLKRSETSFNVLSRSTSSLPEVCIQSALSTARELQIKPIPIGLVNKLRQEEEADKENISPRSATRNHGVYGNATVRQDQVHFVMNPASPESIAKCRQGTEGTVSNLPIMDAPSVPDLNCITPQTLAALISGHAYRNLYHRYYIVDCRFDYEYEGGHIRGAVNVVTPEQIEDLFLRDPDMQCNGNKICIIFHCEFSSHRGPKMYRYLRSMDRSLNADVYPKLNYPEMYLLDGGYKNFYNQFSHLCDPENYVPMSDPKYNAQCKRAMNVHLHKLRKVRSRSCSSLDLSSKRPNVLSHSQPIFSMNDINVDLTASTEL
jgi:rhodanese-related sulfurtransferase